MIDIYSISFWENFLSSKKFLGAMFSQKKPIPIVRKRHRHSQTWQIKFVSFLNVKKVRLGAYESYSRSQEDI